MNHREYKHHDDYLLRCQRYADYLKAKNEAILGKLDCDSTFICWKDKNSQPVQLDEKGGWCKAGMKNLVWVDKEIHDLITLYPESEKEIHAVIFGGYHTPAEVAMMTKAELRYHYLETGCI